MHSPSRTDGFLSNHAPWIAETRAHHAPWFALAEKLNRLAMTVLLREVPNVNEELVVAALYARAVGMFQGAVLLAERGMAAESRTLVRACAETAIALGCARRDKTFPKQLAVDQDKHRLTLANELLGLPESDPNVSPEDRAKLRQIVAQLNAQYAPKGPRRINWAAAAVTAGMTDLYTTVYRSTSADAAHVAIDALDRHVHADAVGTMQGFAFKPAIDEAPDTLASAIAALLHGTEAKLLGANDAVADKALWETFEEFRALLETRATP